MISISYPIAFTALAAVVGISLFAAYAFGYRSGWNMGYVTGAKDAANEFFARRP